MLKSANTNRGQYHGIEDTKSEESSSSTNQASCKASKGKIIVLRLLLVLGFVITCYYYPSSYSMDYLTVEKIDENAARSLYLCFAIMLVWPSLRAVWIYIIEAALIICDAYTKLNMPSGGILHNYYSALHESAYWLELAILITFIIIEYRKCGKYQGNSFYHSMLNRCFCDNNKGNPH